MKLVNNLIQSGIADTDDYQKRRVIILSNYISLILCCAILLLFLNRLTFYDDYLADTFLIGLICFITPIICNRFRYTTLSRLILCIFPVCFIWYAFIIRMRAMSTIDQSVYDGLRIFLLSVCFIPYLLFDKNRLLILILGILPTLISILFFDPLLQFTGVGYESIGYVSDDHQLMSVRTIIAYTVISISCLVFQTIISQNDKFNKKLVSELRNRTEEIEAQNEMLVESQLRLNEINQHLEELVEQKAQDIKRQNEILINYSFTNAHHVRGPVARILGLIQLSKIKTDLNYPWFFEKVEHEAIEIDKIIKRISEDLNDTEIR